MRNPDEVTIRIDKNNYGMVAWFMENGVLTQEYLAAPSAIETLESESSLCNWRGACMRSKGHKGYHSLLDDHEVDG